VTAEDDTLVTAHSVTLTGLNPLRTYHFRVWSEASGYVAHHSGDQTFTTTNAAQSPAGLYQPGWNLTSVPVVPTNPSVTSVFGDLMVLGNLLTNNLYRYQPGVGYDIYPGAFTTIERGRGYWLWLSAADESTVVTVPGQVAVADVPLALASGWNLIGHPQPQAVALANCRVSDGVTTKSFADAVAAGWIGATLYYWDPGSGYRMLNALGYGQDSMLRPWRGYWVNAVGSGLTLVVPRV
jgi:hypothetical protein